MHTINLSYNVPIQVSEALENDDFIIHGVAINSIITDNQHNFLAEELETAAGSLMNKPLLKDHENKTDSIVGRVIGADFDSTTQSVRFKAKINSTEQGKRIRELIKSGDLNTVSIGANVTSMDEENGMLTPKGIKFKELSVVAVPADDGATFTFRGSNFLLALEEAYKKSKEVKYMCEDCDMEFPTEEAYKTHMTEKHSSSNKKMKDSDSPSIEEEKIKKEESMEKDETINESFTERLNEQDKKLEAHTKVLEEVLAGFKSVKESVDSIKASLEAKEKTEVAVPEKAQEVVSEKVAVKEEKEEEPVEEEEEEDTVDEKGKYKIVQGYKSFTIERKYR